MSMLLSLMPSKPFTKMSLDLSPSRNLLVYLMFVHGVAALVFFTMHSFFILMLGLMALLGSFYYQYNKLFGCNAVKCLELEDETGWIVKKNGDKREAKLSRVVWISAKSVILQFLDKSTNKTIKVLIMDDAASQRSYRQFCQYLHTIVLRRQNLSTLL